jgi:hypothetical protein
MPLPVVSPSDVALGSSAEDADYIKRVAHAIEGESRRAVLNGITKRLTSLNCQSDTRYSSPLRGPFTSSQMLQRGTAWGCSAHAQVSCHLARARGIPAILVKSLTQSWVERDNRGDGRGVGHVFVEVLVDDKPMLWEHESGGLFDKYDPAACTCLSPSGEVLYCIYDKGDPDTLILSHHGSEWEWETKRLFPVARKWSKPEP